MSNTGKKRKAVEANEYLNLRNQNIIENMQRMEELNIQPTAQQLETMQQANRNNALQQAKRKKQATNPTPIEGTSIGRNLRSNCRISGPHVDMQATNQHPEDEINEDVPEQPKKNVRGPTTKADIYGRQNKPKLEMDVNEYGQPCGSSGTKFANFIGTLVRTKGFPIAHEDWRKVSASKKYKLWTDAQLYWQVDSRVFNWFMKTAATKWKEFKSDLKKVYDDDMDDDELLAMCDNRVHKDDWKWLINHWRSPEAAARSLRGKANRSKLSQNHTTGSKSHARVGTEMVEELGRPPRRDELFIKTHTHKNGVPHKGAVTTINALQDAIRENPELRDKSIEEGDAYSYVCGAEKNGYVRVVGLGPCPADLEMPGARKYTSTRLQMEIEARRQSDKKVDDLTNRLDKLQETMDRWMHQQLSFQNANSTPHGSNNASQNFRAAPSHHDEEVYEEEQEQDARSDAGGDTTGDVTDRHLHDDANLIMSKRVVLPEEQRNEGGRDVILYSVVRPYDVPVAKATIQTKNPRAIVGGTVLGMQYCEVVVNHVFVRNAVLPRPYEGVTNIVEARGRCIAWPHDRMRDDKKSLQPSKGGGTGRPS